MRKYLVSITLDFLDVGLAASVLSLLVIAAVLVSALLWKATPSYAVDSGERTPSHLWSDAIIPDNNEDLLRALEHIKHCHKLG